MSRSRDTTALAGASLGAGVLAYVLFALTTRVLGAEQAAPVSVLWTFWGLAGAAVTFPIQHWMTREVAAASGFAGLRAQVPVLAGFICAAALVAGAGALLLREQLFGADGASFAGLVVLVTLGSALMGLLRGGLAARGRFRALAATLIAENGLRCVAVGALMALDVRDPVAYGAAIAAGHLAALCWPAALTLPRTGRGDLPTATGVLLGAAGGQLIAQLVLTGAPVVLAVLGGAPADVTALFVAMALFRAPYLVALGVVPQLTGRLTTLVLAGRTSALLRFRALLALASVVAAAAAVPVGLWVGPPLVRVIFGDDVVLDPTVSALVAAGSVLAVANLVASVLAIAHARSRATTVAWLAGLALATPVLVAGLARDERIAAWFLVVEAVALVVLLLSVRTAAEPADGEP